MRVKRGLWVALTLVALAGTLPATPAIAASEDYTGFGASVGECRVGELPWAVCLDVPSGSSVVHVDADDASGQPIVVWAVSLDDRGRMVGEAFACSGSSVDLPAGAAQVDLVVQDPVEAALRGLPCLSNAPTTGTLTATFS